MTINPNLIIVFFALLAILLFVTRIIMFAAKMRNARQSEERLRVLERKVEAISRHLNLSDEIPFSPPIPAPFENVDTSSWNQSNTISQDLSSTNAQIGEEIRHLLRDGRKIEAIKLMRQHSQIGLKEAKDAVEDIEKTL